MWKLWNKLFGWEYVLLASFSCYKIRRAIKHPFSNDMLIKKDGEYLFLRPEGKVEPDNNGKWMPLTKGTLQYQWEVQ